MLVILGDQVDTVIQYIRGGGVKLPQLASYKETAKAAAHADELLAKQHLPVAGIQLERDSTGRATGDSQRRRLPGRIWY